MGRESRMRLERDAFELSELAERWAISAADIRFLVAQGRLGLSVRIVAQPAIQYDIEISQEGDPRRTLVEKGLFNGLVDLALPDAFRLVRDGEARVTDVFLSNDRCVTLRNGEGLLLRNDDLLVRRDRAEALEREVFGVSEGQGEAFDFRMFVHDETEFAFTLPQARALEFMLAQTRAGAPDQHYLEILNAVGSASQRLSSLFSRKPHWKRLLRKTPGRRGWYHLDPRFVIWLIATA